MFRINTPRGKHRPANLLTPRRARVILQENGIPTKPLPAPRVRRTFEGAAA